MDWLMKVLTPQDTLGFVLRFALLVGVVAIANTVFSLVVDQRKACHEPSHDILHAIFVGGPLISFFLAVSVYQIKLQRRLSILSRKDGLTGLHNRRSFLQITDKCRAESQKGVLLMLDADWFKTINDTHGHQAGDLALKAIARMLRSNLRADDIVGRLGGEEFAVFLNGMTIEQAREVGKRLVKPVAFRTPSGAQLTVTVSIGAVTDHAQSSLDQLFTQADKALYRAKESGRAKLVVWEEIASTSKLSN